MPSSLTLWPELGNREPAGFMGPRGAVSFAGSRCRSPQRQISETGGLSLAGGTDDEGEHVHPYARDDGETHQASLTQR